MIALAMVAGGAACDGDPAGTDGGAHDGGSSPVEDGGDVALLPGQECAPACSTDDWPYAPESIGFQSEYACYDGCNWFYCTDEGPQILTARFCADAGAADGGEP